MTRSSAGGQYDVMVVGEYYFDLIFKGLPETPTVGADLWADEFDALPGASFTTALAFARLGTRAGWWCTFGNDIFSRMVLEEAEREGIDDGLFTILPEPRSRVSSAFTFAHDRGFISYSADEDPLPTAQDLQRTAPRILLLQGLSLAEERIGLMAAARDMGILVCSDCQHTDMTLETPGLTKALELIDVFLPNAAEAAMLTGTGDGDAALDKLGRHCSSVVIKNGRDGAIALHEGGRQAVPALKVEVVDTTGAGDSFNAGFVHGLLTEQSFREAMETGVICGSLSVSGFGGRNLPDRAGVEKHRRTMA